MTDDRNDSEPTRIERNDLAPRELIGELGDYLLGPGGKSVRSGWLAPEIAWAFYWQNGNVRQAINRFCVLMTKAGWDYTDADIKFRWSSVQSALQTKRLKQRMRLAATWAFVFGGAAIEHLVDDADRPKSEPLDLDTVRAYRGMHVWSAYDLRPQQGRNYATAEYFIPRNWGDAKRIHRSRLTTMVATDVPGTNLGSSLFINPLTQWPPSWLEGVYDPFCDYKRAHFNATQIMRSKSILHLMLAGYRLVSQSPSSPEAVALENNLTQILNDLDNTGMLITDIEDKLAEVERSLSGISDLLQSKALFAASAFGVPKELFLMEADGNLGTKSAPYDAYNDMIDGWRDMMITPVIERSTDIQLRVERKRSVYAGEPIEIPTQYTVSHRPIQEQDEAEAAKSRKDRSDARKNDAESLPNEVLLSDPTLAKDYPGLDPWLEQQEENRAAAKAAAVEAEVDDPDGEDMVSAATVARKIGLSPTTVNKMATTGALPGRKVAGRWRFYLSRVIAATKATDTSADRLDEMWTELERTDAELGLSTNTQFGDAYGASVAMREIFAVLERVRDSDLAVLLLGETGTGKGGIARGLHGDRVGKLVTVNCAAVPRELDDLAEFMRERIADAKDGTLFLDEIGDLPRDAQSALLVELGNADARLISATSLDVRDEWNFRPDLLYRLAEVDIEIPPLRDRETDVHELARRFYAAYTAEAGIQPADPPFTAAALETMLVYPWPGNVRELLGAVRRGAQLAGHARSIGPEHMQLRLAGRR